MSYISRQLLCILILWAAFLRRDRRETFFAHKSDGTFGDTYFVAIVIIQPAKL